MGRLWRGAIGQGGSVAVEEDVMDAMVLDFLMAWLRARRWMAPFFNRECIEINTRRRDHLIDRYEDATAK